MPDQITRNNHYVPQRYQRRFLAPGKSKLHYLDMSPDKKELPDGRTVVMNAFNEWGPVSCFYELDLYTTHLGSVVNDEIEKFLFGPIDDKGAKAVHAFASGDPSAMYDVFEDFFEYLDAQKLRTPKGLDWIKSRYTSLDQLTLMAEMQALRLMHCTMWTEGVREIVSAEESDVKFIVSDHPVTVYNAAAPPTSPLCAYPDDPSIEWIGTQTVFVLDANTCLILTHLEYAQDPKAANLTAPRTHARYRGSSFVSRDAFIRTRKLARDGVIAINHLLKSRARRYMAASDKEWLLRKNRSPRNGMTSRNCYCRRMSSGDSAAKSTSYTRMAQSITKMSLGAPQELTSICDERSAKLTQLPMTTVAAEAVASSNFAAGICHKPTAQRGMSTAFANAI